MVNIELTLKIIMSTDMNINVAYPPDSLKKLLRAEIDYRIREAREKLSDTLLILGHHYQRDEVFKYADATGDSFALAKTAAKASAEFIVFCGVHFMAETADIITSPDQKVFLPNATAGCSLADMADIQKVEKAWEEINANTEDRNIPITYINSNVELKAFCGRNGGIVCTSSNARSALEWAWRKGDRILFFPDQHLGRNTAYKMGIPLEQMVMWDPEQRCGGNSVEKISSSKIVLWRGYCDVHQHFTKEYIDYLREKYPAINIIAHPECNFKVAQYANYMGSTEYIIKKVKESAKGTKWGVGTEKRLVNRLQKQYPEKEIFFLQEYGPECETMSSITQAHLLFQLESLVKGNLINRVSVEDDIKKDALIAINRMLDL